MVENDIKEYRALRQQVDELCDKFTDMHRSQLSCKKGCDSCCESLRIFPVEYYSIQQELAGKKIPPIKWHHRYSKKCRFLVNSACAIYDSRPIICRTQGLPLLYENSTGTAYELSVCQLNFKGMSVDTFNMDNALFMPPINSKLFMINHALVNSSNLAKKSPKFRIKLNTLRFDL